MPEKWLKPRPEYANLARACALRNEERFYYTCPISIHFLARGKRAKAHLADESVAAHGHEAVRKLDGFDQRCSGFEPRG